ncbi:STAS domain-containing protein [Chitinimonas arctica]|uniref:STAS domain-containing protein n=1 Tax=Chitinimonas arctica TaxID=2594795 RepID=A0A516SBQ8_9NEIS|nr:STAS domain-containing protein [Chitinimonas arctica]QDQ25580.1 STAS domain-containing protein [Chitinimonas arctica]
MKTQNLVLDEILQNDLKQFIEDWLAESLQDGALVRAPASAQTDAAKLVRALRDGIRADGEPAQFEAPPWANLHAVLHELSASRAAQGASAGDTSRFVLAIKRPIFAALQLRITEDVRALMEAIWWNSNLADKMAQYAARAYQSSREEVIHRQQQELLELSTPVIKLWDGVLAVPIIGTLDSGRTQLVMESLLQRLVETGSELAIVDITGVPTVDTLVAQHLIKTVTAIRLMGADCIISGIRPQIAQTIVHLGIELQGITTKATLADALGLALKATGHLVTRATA